MTEQGDMTTSNGCDGENGRQLPFKEMVEKINDGILVVEMDGRIIYANPSMADMIGYTREEISEAALFDFMDDEWAHRARQNLERRKRGVEETFDHQWQHKNGDGVWTLVSAKPMKDREGNQWGSLVAIQEISERKRMEKQLRQARDQLEQRVRERTRELRQANARLEREVEERTAAEQKAREANQAKSTFLANMSHELRTPLNAVIGYSELLQEELQECEDPSRLSLDQLESDLNKIASAGGHLLALINDILHLTKIEAGRLEMNFEPFDLEEMIEEAVDTVRPRVDANDNQLRVEHGYGERFVGDRTRLKQVVLNLVGNAAKFTHGGTITVSTHGDRVGGGPGVCIEVSDTGIGMREDNIEELFEPFTQADDSATREYGGTGLGLTICRRFVDRMGGSIEVESQQEVGTTFTVRLPAKSSQRGCGDEETDTPCEDTEDGANC